MNYCDYHVTQNEARESDADYAFCYSLQNSMMWVLEALIMEKLKAAELPCRSGLKVQG